MYNIFNIILTCTSTCVYNSYLLIHTRTHVCIAHTSRVYQMTTTQIQVTKIIHIFIYLFLYNMIRMKTNVFLKAAHSNKRLALFQSHMRSTLHCG